MPSKKQQGFHRLRHLGTPSKPRDSGYLTTAPKPRYFDPVRSQQGRSNLNDAFVARLGPKRPRLRRTQPIEQSYSPTNPALGIPLPPEQSDSSDEEDQPVLPSIEERVAAADATKASRQKEDEAYAKLIQRVGRLHAYDGSTANSLPSLDPFVRRVTREKKDDAPEGDENQVDVTVIKSGWAEQSHPTLTGAMRMNDMSTRALSIDELLAKRLGALPSHQEMLKQYPAPPSRAWSPEEQQRHEQMAGQALRIRNAATDGLYQVSPEERDRLQQVHTSNLEQHQEAKTAFVAKRAGFADYLKAFIPTARTCPRTRLQKPNPDYQGLA